MRTSIYSCGAAAVFNQSLIIILVLSYKSLGTYRGNSLEFITGLIISQGRSLKNMKIHINSGKLAVR